MALQDTVIRGGRVYPERPALLFEGETWTYGEIDAITDRMAAGLLGQGMQRGERVALLFANCPELVFGYYACFKAGLIAVPLNIRLKAPELAYVLEHSGARMLLGQAALFRELVTVRTELAALEMCFLTGAYDGLEDVQDFAELQAAEIVALPDVDGDAPTIILYTSGTTARPKGVTHSHTSLEQLVASCLAVFRSDVSSVSAIAPPLFHLGSLTALLIAFQIGGEVVVFPKFDPVTILQGLEAHKVTFFWLLPVMYGALLHVPNVGAYDLSSIKVMLNAGDSMPEEIRARLKATFGRDILDVCGMTEMMYSLNPLDSRARPGSIGLPLPGVRMRLVDSSGRDVAQGEVGEILAQGTGRMLGYWEAPELTADVVRDGWLHTGDLAWQDAEGYYWFAGRKKDIIIRGGSNISPAEVEDALYSHPAVAAAGVIGVPDPVWGEVVWAYVSLKADAVVEATTLQAHLRERIAEYKTPERIHIVPSLPIGPTGKIQRQTLREWAAGV